MNRLFIILSIFCSVSLLLAQGPNPHLSALEAKIKGEPALAAQFMADAIVARPENLSELVATALAASNADGNSDMLREIMAQAVRQCPTRSSEIAEAALLSAPNQAETIRQIFLGETERLAATPPMPADSPPSEKFLATHRTAKPYDPEDVANQALETIDAFLIELAVSPDAPTSKSRPRTDPEVFNLSLPDQDIEISTFIDPLIVDRDDETVAGSSTESVKIDDAALQLRLSESLTQLALSSPDASVLETADAAAAAQQVTEKGAPWHSTVYPVGSIGRTSPALAMIPVIRGIPASETIPRFRFR